ncbi:MULTISPECIES: hypothetical protein [Rhodococcus erythropolis group]|uniref:DUF2158 domain-containing protein n=2 Tax=Rhodococcus erythropolis group TaxID=2840174 RepID=A0AAW6LSX4_RHOSG|nr:hypothetical protein [Rhodococcus qingshengii]MDE8647558.1 hypothetical protein [Rhodococcus qingshengii]
MIQRSAIQLSEGDVIVAEDGQRHTVTKIQNHGLEGAWLTIITDTGIKLDKSHVAAKLDVYDVEPAGEASPS